MSCLHKRLKKNKSEEEAFLEKARRIAHENGKRLGKSPPKKGVKCVRALGLYSFVWAQNDGSAHIEYLDHLGEIFM